MDGTVNTLTCFVHEPPMEGLCNLTKHCWMLLMVRPGNKTEKAAAQQLSSGVHQSSVQTLESLHQIFIISFDAVFSKEQMRLRSSACAPHESRRPSLSPLLKCFPALPAWHVLILCFSNMEKQKQKENNEVRRGCLEKTMAGGLVLRRSRRAPWDLQRYAVMISSHPGEKRFTQRQKHTRRIRWN